MNSWKLPRNMYLKHYQEMCTSENNQKIWTLENYQEIFTLNITKICVLLKITKKYVLENFQKICTFEHYQDMCTTENNQKIFALEHYQDICTSENSQAEHYLAHLWLQWNFCYIFKEDILAHFYLNGHRHFQDFDRLYLPDNFCTYYMILFDDQMELFFSASLDSFSVDCTYRLKNELL